MLTVTLQAIVNVIRFGKSVDCPLSNAQSGTATRQETSGGGTMDLSDRSYPRPGS